MRVAQQERGQFLGWRAPSDHLRLHWDRRRLADKGSARRRGTGAPRLVGAAVRKRAR